MRLWDALSDAMGTSGIRRIGSREAEQLLTADSDASAYPGLSQLLAAATAPPRPDELTGLNPAVAAFEAAGRQDPPSLPAAGVRRVFARSVAVKAATGIAVVLFGGTALAAETGNLPGRSQQHAHDLFSALGVPPPSAGAISAAPTTPAAVPVPVPVPTPSSGARTATPGPTSPATVGLCRSWLARQKNPKNKPINGAALRKLAAAAGGEQHIAAFCTALLGDGPAPTATTQGPGTAAPTPSHPGNGKGHSKPTPNPHKKG
jgi:hypothetical protein